MFFRKNFYPAILLYWKEYQERMKLEMTSAKTPLAVAGDGRHDSM